MCVHKEHLHQKKKKKRNKKDHKREQRSEDEKNKQTQMDGSSSSSSTGSGSTPWILDYFSIVHDIDDSIEIIRIITDYQIIIILEINKSYVRLFFHLLLYSEPNKHSEILLNFQISFFFSVCETTSLFVDWLLMVIVRTELILQYHSEHIYYTYLNMAYDSKYIWQ